MAAARPPAKGLKGPRLNFKLELSCACKPPICPHAGPGIAKLLEGAYAKGRADGERARRGSPTRRSGLGGERRVH